MSENPTTGFIIKAASANGQVMWSGRLSTATAPSATARALKSL
ncbi:MAG TPA: hypothetical protein VFG04_30900 [Planctomycetaceae bacterium]|nr:hypothetical protein [Planctomycetaceae bacterium]